MTVIRALLLILFALVGSAFARLARCGLYRDEAGNFIHGAFLGLAVSLFGGISEFTAHPYLMAGVGAFAMHLGDMADTRQSYLAVTESRPAPRYRHGMLGLFVQGAVAFGLFGGYVGIYISFMSGMYTVMQLVSMALLMPVFAYGVYRSFNLPFDPESNVFPKTYFSAGRRETWGILLGLLAEVVMLSMFASDGLALLLAVVCALFGGAGKTLGALAASRTLFTNRNGKYLFNRFTVDGYINDKTLFDVVYGLICGLGFALAFTLSGPILARRSVLINSRGIVSVLDERATQLIVILLIALLLLDQAKYLLPALIGEKRVSKLFEISGKTEYVLYSIAPLLLSFAGITSVTEIYATVIFGFILLRAFSDFLQTSKRGKQLLLVCLFAVIALYVVRLFTRWNAGAVFLTSIYTLMLMGAGLLMHYIGDRSMRFSRREQAADFAQGACAVVLLGLSFLTL